MSTPTRRRTLRARLLAFIRDATGRLTAAWRILTGAQNTLLAALSRIRPGRNAPALIRTAALAFQRSLADFDRAVGSFTERWAATDLPLAYREGAYGMLDRADRPRRSWSWTTRHQNAVTALSAQYYADLTGRLQEALRRARAFMRAAVDAARARITQYTVGAFDPAALRAEHPLGTVIYVNDARHPVETWAAAALSWQAVTTANAGAVTTAYEQLGTTHVKVKDGPQCVMPGGSFLPHGHLEQMVRAWYSGPAYRIARSTGVGLDFITVGPNHPVLTERGWVRAHLLREGDQLVYDRLSEDPATRAELHLKQVPMVEDVYASIMELLPVTVRPATRNDLHGDGVFSQGEVHVVDVKCGLLREADPSAAQHVGEDDFVGPDDRINSLLGDGPSAVALRPLGAPSNGCVCSPGTAFPGVGPGVRMPQAKRFGTGPRDLHALHGAVHLRDLEPEEVGDLARLASVFDVEASYLLTRDPGTSDPRTLVPAESGCTVVVRAELGSAHLAGDADSVLPAVHLPQRFSFSRVDRISITHYEGWVYDATTSGGTFTIDGVILSNCGWVSHKDSDIADGTIRDIDDALAHPSAHPNCIREFLPHFNRPDILGGAT